MDSDELERWAIEFEDFHARFAHFSVRNEPRKTTRQYLRGLLSQVRRKNCWQMAEEVGGRDPQPTQRLLYSTPWDEDAVRDELQYFVIERFGDESSWVQTLTTSPQRSLW